MPRLHHAGEWSVQASTRSLKRLSVVARMYVLRAEEEGLGWPLPESVCVGALRARHDQESIEWDAPAEGTVSGSPIARGPAVRDPFALVVDTGGASTGHTDDVVEADLDHVHAVADSGDVRCVHGDREGGNGGICMVAVESAAMGGPRRAPRPRRPLHAHASAPRWLCE